MLQWNMGSKAVLFLSVAERGNSAAKRFPPPVLTFQRQLFWLNILSSMDILRALIWLNIGCNPQP